jgi:putative transposase
VEGRLVNIKWVRRLMRLMGLMPIYRRPRTSIPAKGHKLYPYLLRGVRIDRPNQVWCADITYIPLAKGFLYLVAIMDWWSRKVLAWRLSNTMDVQLCVDALDDALSRYDPSEIFNTDQGSQFTSWVSTQRLKEGGVRISMDGRGRILDNTFIERLCHSLKYECIHLYAFSGRREARQGIGDWMLFYNHRRTHAAHGGETPVGVYRERLSASGPGLRPDLHPTAKAA